MRVTRAAQRAQQDVEEPIEAHEVNERALKDIEPNASPAPQIDEPLPAKTPAKKGKAKGGKKGAKGKKAKTEEEELAQVVEDAEREAAVSAVNECADQDLAQEHTGDVVQTSNNDDQSKVPQTPAVRLTRRQLAKLGEEALAQSHCASSSQPEGKVVVDAAEVSSQLAEENVELKDDGAAEEEEAPVVLDEPVEPEPVPVAEPAVKPVRLTRRQQAKLEEELKQSQVDQQTSQPEPTQEAVSEEIVTKVPAEASTTEQDSVPEKTSGDNRSGIQDNAVPMVAAEERSTAQESAIDEPQDNLVEIDALDETNIDSRMSEVVEAENLSNKPVDARPATPSEAEFEADVESPVQNTDQDEIKPSAEITSEIEPKMLSAEKPFEASAATPARSETSGRRTSRSPSKSPMRIEESISAIDRLEEDLESIGKAIPDFEHSDDENSPRKFTEPIVPSTSRGKTPARTPAEASSRTPAKIASKTPSKAPVKAPVATRAPVAAKAPLPARISKVPNAAPKSVKPTSTSLARASSVRTAPSKDVKKPSVETADYLASKRRPISLSFPTPPPPPKGRAPTKSTFQLSSDNVAAKLKAQREERLKREAEGAAAPKHRPISMPPPPKSTKPPTIPSFQLPGEATAAKLKARKEERLKRMEEAGGAEKPVARPISMPPPPKSTKQLTKPSFQLPGEATAARLKAQKEERLKRMEEAEAAKKAAAAAAVRKPMAHRPRESLLAKDMIGVSIPPPSNSDAPQRSASLASKRSSIIGASASRSTSTSSANRNSLLLAAGSKFTVTPDDAAALKVKGKQIFNRDRIEKEAMERERREKEEAAKKARAEAAERGRIASREWAERQRKKMMGH